MTTKPITESYNLYDLTDFEAKVDAYLESVTDSETGEINANPEEMMAAMAASEGVEAQIETVLEYTCKSIRNQESRLKRIYAAEAELIKRMDDLIKPISEEIDVLHDKRTRINKDIDWRKGALRHHLLSKGKLTEGKRAGLYPKIDLGTFKLSIRTSKSVSIANDVVLEHLPERWITARIQVDKALIKREILEGNSYEGIQLVETHSLTIK